MTPDRRMILAIVLILVFWFGYERLFPAPKLRPGATAADSAAVLHRGAASGGSSSVATSAATPAPSQAVTALPNLPPASATIPPQPASAASAGLPQVRPETLTVNAQAAVVTLTNIGAAPLAVTMRDYHTTVRAEGQQGPAPEVRLGEPGQTLLSYLLITPHDTIALDRVAFRASRSAAPDGHATVDFQADVPKPAGGTVHVDIDYAFDGEGYTSRVTGTISGLGSTTAGDYLMTALPTGFPSYEADTADDIRQLGYSYKQQREDASSVSFSRLQPDKPELIPGPLSWVAAKNKYFVVGLLASDTSRSHEFAELQLVGAPRVGGVAVHAQAAALLPLWPATANASPAAPATFSFELYAGPQDYRRLQAFGRGFENLNPYGGFFHVIFQPFVTLVIVAILGMRQLLHINYGWILIILGIATRILLWPLNQRAMRTSLKMQRLQPEIQAVQTKYKNDQARLQQEMMRVYREQGMSPWSPIAGCLPMLLPWPIFAALYFVFRTTIEFRGVPFLWMHDISVRDPYYIMPVLMGLTMFLTSWIGMRNVPPNPQTKMMSYMFPAMMTFFFWKIAAGLNLYYFVQNLATIPQQWYLSNERAKAGIPGAPATSTGAGGRKGPQQVSGVRGQLPGTNRKA